MQNTIESAFPIVARTYTSMYERGTRNYWGVIKASDNKVYYTISYDRNNPGDTVQLYCMDPETEKIRPVGDIRAAVGEKGRKCIAQGKAHVSLIEHKGKLYFATHLGYYGPTVDGVEGAPVPPQGYESYGGGHFLAYDLERGEVDDLATVEPGEGIITMGMDRRREKLYGLTFATGIIYSYDLPSGELTRIGNVYGKGEGGRGREYDRICRAFGINPDDGNVYWSKSNGEIYSYDPVTEKVQLVEGCDLNLPEFSPYDKKGEVLLGNFWRTVVWHPEEKVFYGLNCRLEYLFKFDPAKRTTEAVRDFCLESPNEALLGFTLAPDDETLSYFSTGPCNRFAAEMGAKQTLHYVTYHIPSELYTDHGAIRVLGSDGKYSCPYRSNAIEILPDGMVYTVVWQMLDGETYMNFVSFVDPRTVS